MELTGVKELSIPKVYATFCKKKTKKTEPKN